MRRPALIFDFGNVVAHFDYTRASARLGERLGISGEELLARLGKLGFSDVLRSYESGKLTAEEFSRKVGEMIELEVTHEEFAAAWSDIFTANASVGRLVKALKAEGYTLVLGSNTNDLHAAQFRRQFVETLGNFDRLVLSYEVGQVKPSAGFYHACAEAAGAEPADCLFIDDMPENVAGAEAAGLRALLYQGTEKLVEDLEALGIEVDPDDVNPMLRAGKG